MNRTSLSDYSKKIVIALGFICMAAALIALPLNPPGWGLVLILAFSVLIAPRMTLTLPRSKFAISFSDALIFLTFLLYGGMAAVIVAAAETAASCYYLRSKGFPFGRLMIPANVSMTTIAATATFLGYSLLPFFGFELVPWRTPHLITILGILAMTYFLVSSLLAAWFQSLKDGTGIWQTWKKDCFSSSMTQIVGAGLAGIIFKLINYSDLITAVIAFAALAVAYLNYRQSIGEINSAFAQIEEAERQKAITERERRREAEAHASQLAMSLDKEEKANAALRKSEADFQYAALHDSLTDLANRKHLGDILRSLISTYKENPSVTFHVLFVDIKGFKNINDSLGHTFGDKVLLIAAKRLVKMLNPTDTVARIGGDEFAIILRNLTTVGKAQKVARRVYQSISQPFSLSGNRISISLNIGIAPCDAEYNTPEEILRDADIAMHYAKEKGTGVAVFTKELRARFLERVRYEMDLRNAIDRNELSVYYQPVVALEDRRIVGFEALLRWKHEEFGNISPSKFIPIAEESGLIIPITEWVLAVTTRQLVEWQKISPAYRDLVVSVNISGKHLSQGDLVEDVENALSRSNLSAASLKLEITESTAMENAEHTINVLHALKKLGVQLSIDDFGTGYSSLSYLHRLPFDTLKIDRSFVYSVGESGENSEVLQTIISLAKNLKMRVIAEGIETESQYSLLANLGCDYGQGFLLARPRPSEEAEKLLYTRPSWSRVGQLNDVSTPSRRPTDEQHLPVF